MNIAAIILLIMAVLAIVIFILRQNFKDRKNLTNQLNQDYRKAKEEEGDIDIDEIKH